MRSQNGDVQEMTLHSRLQRQPKSLLLPAYLSCSVVVLDDVMPGCGYGLSMQLYYSRATFARRQQVKRLGTPDHTIGLDGTGKLAMITTDQGTNDIHEVLVD